MNRNRIFAAAACALLLHTGCASLERTAVTSAPLALVGVPKPAKLSVIIHNHPNATGSQVQGLFFAAEMFTKERLLTEALKSQAFSPATVFTDAFAEALPRPGRAVVLAANPQGDREDFLQDYAVLGAEAEIYLDIVPRAVGYWAESLGGAYLPWVIVAYRVYDHRRGKVLTSGLIGTGPAAADETVINVAHDNQFAFASFEALTNDPVRAVAGLRAAIRQVALALAQKL